MLQRYTFLRLQRLSLLEKKRLMQHAEQEAGHCETGHLTESDLLFAAGMREKLLSGENVILRREDCPVLLRLAACFPENETVPTDDGVPGKADALCLAESAVKLAGKTETFVSRLQRSFTPKHKTVSQRCAVITGDGETDRSFRRLFPDPAPEKILFRLAVLHVLEAQR